MRPGAVLLIALSAGVLVSCGKSSPNCDSTKAIDFILAAMKAQNLFVAMVSEKGIFSHSITHVRERSYDSKASKRYCVARYNLGVDPAALSKHPDAQFFSALSSAQELKYSIQLTLEGEIYVVLGE